MTQVVTKAAQLTTERRADERRELAALVGVRTGAVVARIIGKVLKSRRR